MMHRMRPMNRSPGKNPVRAPRQDPNLPHHLLRIRKPIRVMVVKVVKVVHPMGVVETRVEATVVSQEAATPQEGVMEAHPVVEVKALEEGMHPEVVEIKVVMVAVPLLGIAPRRRRPPMFHPLHSIPPLPPPVPRPQMQLQVDHP